MCNGYIYLPIMEWIYPWTEEEWIWVLLFLLSYLWYGAKIWQASRLLRQRCSKWIYKLLLRATVFALLVVALLGPSLENERQEVEIRSKDIFFCLDASSSMDAVDISPSRIEKVKLELKHMVEELNGDRIGLIIFSSEAFMQCPLTQDISAISLFVDAVRTDLVPRGGTDFGEALRMGYKKLQKAAKQHRRPTAQVLVLISDGEDFGEETQDVLQDIRQSKTKLFTLGVGSEEGSQIPSSSGIRRDRQGRAIHTRLMRSSLQQIGEQYFEITPQINQCSQLVSELRKIKGTLHRQESTQGSLNMYRYFLFVALALCILDVLVPLRLFRI